VSRGVRPPGPRALKVGENVREVREQKGLTRRELAQRIGGPVTDGVVTNLELGRSVMTLEQFLDLCDGLKVRPGVLLRDLPGA
jgi:transcriptional regulator with XRE-family HTH domain